MIVGALNARDVGGLRAGERRTRPGVLLRSGNLSRVGIDGATRLRELGVRRIVDLRSADEVAADPTVLPGVEFETVRVPLFAGSTASFFAADLTLAALYRDLIDRSGAQIAQAVRALASAQPVLVHCTVGKDRTGVVIALALSAIGVDTEDVIADYARTENELPPQRSARVLAYLRSVHPEARNLDELANRSPAPVMREFLADVDVRYGGAAAYLRAHGLGRDELAVLAAALLPPS